MSEISELVRKGKDYLENMKYDESLGCFEQAILSSPHDPDLWNFKGVVLRSMGRYNEAMECFNKSLEIDPRDKNVS